jgi:hypothetical protein
MASGGIGSPSGARRLNPYVTQMHRPSTVHTYTKKNPIMLRHPSVLEGPRGVCLYDDVRQTNERLLECLLWRDF